MPSPIKDISRSALAKVRYVLTDFDDTLTWHGKLPVATLSALYALKQAGIQVIPVTGGCAGWSDMMAAVLPVSGVITEGGGVYLHLQEKRIHYHFFADKKEMSQQQQSILDEVQRLLPSYPSLRLARDQHYRLTDVAIDYAQEIVPPAVSEKNAILSELVASGLNAKASSIHINICQHGVDKLAMAERVLTEFWGVSKDSLAEQVLYVGDAPNDQSMFSRFPLSVGVANIQPYLSSMQHLPNYVTRLPGGEGFAEVAERLLEVEN